MFPKSYNHSNPLTTSLSTSYSPPLWRGWGWVRTIIIYIALLVGGAFFSSAGNADAQNLLTRSTPEAEGLSSEHVHRFFERLMQDRRAEVHSCIVMRHGQVMAEMYPKPWRKDYRHTMYSVSKTFTSAAVGMCIADSLFSLQDSIGKFFPLLLPENASDTLLAITVRDLLTMQSGLPVDTKMRMHETEWIKAYLHKKPTSLPGTRWAYDSIVTYLLSAIVQEASDMSLMSLLQERLFLPLGISDAAWEESPEGVTCGGWGLYIRPEAMAKFGQLLLNGGTWNGVSLIPREWVGEMMKPQSINGRYGYQMWQCSQAGWAEANGAYGQFIYVIPEADMVVTLTQCNSQRVPIQEWIKEMLVDNCQDNALSKNEQHISFAHYTHPTASGNGNGNKVFTPIKLNLEDNILGWEGMTIRTRQDKIVLDITDSRSQQYSITLGNKEWIESEFKGRPYYNPPFMNDFSNLPTTWHVAGSYGWQGDNLLNISLHWIDWLTSAKLQIKFSGASASLTFKPRDTGKETYIKAWVK